MHVRWQRYDPGYHHSPEALMNNAADHYENLLAEHYTWMFGGTPEEKAAEQRRLLEQLGLKGGELAVDLGAGSGFQALALADMGFRRVVGIDTSPKLLAELQANRGTRPVAVVQDDMMRVSDHIGPGTADVVVCMGDTLPHLPARELVPALFASVQRALKAHGLFVVSFRDLSIEKHGLDRFITVRATPDKIMTCFLEFGADIVMVHDLIHVRDGESWRLVKSCYPKLRLSVDEVRGALGRAGLEVYTQDTVNGLSVLAARKS
jgi:SAM-dependent methyltransferase